MRRYGALARRSGTAPTSMFEPSLTVGLVPRTASRVVATHNYPTTKFFFLVEAES
jgi:hypothetical protein